VIHNCRWRLQPASGDHRYALLEHELQQYPEIAVPSITIGSDFDGAAADGAHYRAQFTHRNIGRPSAQRFRISRKGSRHTYDSRPDRKQHERQSKKAYPKPAYYKEHDIGDHFAAWEQPQLLSEDSRGTFRYVR
jgi:hypothetical protein